MKLKKKTSIMMAAASAVAVVGIAAVSFAAWTGSNNTFTASANTGTVTLTGFSSESGSFTENLVPYDQPKTTWGENSVNVISIDVPTFTVYSDYSIEFKLEYTNGAPTVGENQKFDIYVNYGNEAVTTSTVESWTAIPNTFHQITAADNGSWTFTDGGYSASAISGKYINVVLDSNYVGDKDTSNPFSGISFKIVAELISVD